MLKFGGFLPSKHNFHALHINNYIKNQRNLRIIGISASFILFIISALTIYPIVKNSTSAEAINTPVTADTVLTFTSTFPSANLDLLVKDNSGTFASSSSTEMAKFNVVTNNYTGYTLSILSSEDNNGQLSSNDESNKTVFKSIEHYTDADTFKNGSSTLYNNKWGYLPSRYNSEDNTFFRPAPTETATTLDETNTASKKKSSTDGSTDSSVASDGVNCDNYDCSEYTIALGARADYSTPNGVYSNTFVLTLVANSIPYTLSFTDTTGDSSVSNLPTSPITGETADTKIAIPTNIPTRTGYTFAGWCDVEPTILDNGSTSCIDASTGEAGTVYSASTEEVTSYFNFINQTVESNIATLYTMWTINSYTCTKQYRLQNADGTFPTSYTVDETETEQVEYKSTCTYSKSITDYKSTADGTNDSEATVSGVMDSTEGITLSLDFYRNTFALTVNRNTTYISSASATTAAVHGTNYYRWGQSVNISASPTSTGKFTSWSQTAGTSSSFGSTTSASTTFVMPTSAATIYADGAQACVSTISGVMQSYTTAISSMCDTASGSLTDNRDNISYTVARIDNLLWMTSNLRFQGTSITTANTNIDRNKSISWHDQSSDSNCYPANSETPMNNTNSTLYCKTSGTDSSGNSTVWYNYVAASGGTVIGLSNTSDAQYSICPYNWRLPSRTEYLAIRNKDGSDTWFDSRFKGVGGGAYTSSGGTKSSTKYGYYWTSTYYYAGETTEGMSRVAGKYVTEDFKDGTVILFRSSGLYIRCVRSF